MQIPNNVEFILKKIYSSENEWKALYMATWGWFFKIEKDGFVQIWEKEDSLTNTSSSVAGYQANPTIATSFFVSKENQNSEEAKIELRLPSSKQGSYTFDIIELLSILRGKNEQFTFGHLQTLFSLFEELLIEFTTILPDTIKKNLNTNWASNSNEIKNFLEKDIFKDIIPPEEINELILAKIFRNKYEHNGAKVDKQLSAVYKMVRKINIDHLKNKHLREVFNKDNNQNQQNLFWQIEDWHNLIVKIAKKLENYIKSIPYQPKKSIKK